MHRRTKLLLAATLAGALLLPAAGSTGAVRREASSTASATTYRVRILDNYFKPARITISPGDRIRWVNRGEVVHTTTSRTGLWHRSLAPGETYTRTFRKAGTYRYYCTLHSGQTGRIVVD